MKRKIILLGSTGSIGKSVLDVISHNSDHLEIVALSCYANLEEISLQVKKTTPKAICIFQNENKLKLSPSLKIFIGEQGLEQMIQQTTADLVVCAISGYQGIYSMLTAIRLKIPVAIANKEPLVVAGKIIMQQAQQNSVPIYPIDSEHNAIFQCIQKEKISDIKNITITASGGPFFNTKKEFFSKITLSQALKHPRWKMGTKNTLDSATTMNKALEIIEAHWLFGIDVKKIKVVVHPQSILHALVQYKDGSCLAQLGSTDMKIAISYCLGKGKRLLSGAQSLDLLELKTLEFLPLEEDKFPCVALMRQCTKLGEGLPAAMNGINEVFIKSLLSEKISFYQVMQGYNLWMDFVKNILEKPNCPPFLKSIYCLADALQANNWGMNSFSQLRLPTS